MTSRAGKFVWYELMTSDPKAAEKFYSAVVGWTAKDSGMPGMNYTLFYTGEKMVGGLMAVPPDAAAMGVTPIWMGYIAVDDVDTTASRVKQAGGAIHRPPSDIPGVGRFAVAADPGGAGFCLFKGEGEPAAEPPFDQPGFIGWHELHAADGPKAFDFYAGLFGWTKDQAMDMGEMGVYQTFAPAGGKAMGGMMTKTTDTPKPIWLYYLRVDGIEAAKARVEKAGGRIVMGPMEVPGGQWIINGIDPQGAMFALLGPKS